jgi:hypothetical protein
MAGILTPTGGDKKLSDRRPPLFSGTLSDDRLFADFYSSHERPVAVAPWCLALVMVMRYSEGLTDGQAADAVRCCLDWK